MPFDPTDPTDPLDQILAARQSGGGGLASPQPSDDPLDQILAARQQPQQPGILDRSIAALKGFLPQGDESVLHTVGRDVTGLAEGLVQPFATLGKEAVYDLADPLHVAGNILPFDRPTPKDVLLAAPQALATVFAGPVEGALADAMGGTLASKVVAGGLVGAGAGALFTPSDPLVGAVVGGAIGTPLGALHTTKNGGIAKDLTGRPDGFTFDPRTGQHVTQGIAVGLGNDAGVHQVITPEITASDIHTVFTKNADLFSDPHVMLGGWRDDSGAFHLEPSFMFSDPSLAFKAGVEKGQKGIGDVGVYAQGGEGFIDTSSDRAKAIYQLMQDQGLSYARASELVSAHEAETSPAGSTAHAAGAADVGGGAAPGAADAGVAGAGGGNAGLPPTGHALVAGGEAGGVAGDGGADLPAVPTGEPAAGGPGGTEPPGVERDLNGFDRDPADFAAWFNRAKIATADPLASRIINLQMGRTADSLGPKVRVSHAETLAAAKELAVDPEALARGAKHMTKEEFLAGRLTIRRNGMAIAGLSRAFPTAANPAEIEQMIRSLDRQSDAILNRMAPSRSEFGRALNSLKQAANQTTDPVYWMLKAKDALGKDRVFTDEMRRDIEAKLGAIDRAPNAFQRNQAIARLAKGIVQLTPSTPAEKAITLLRANLLSTPSSLIGAAAGHLGFAGLDAVDKNLAGLFDAIVGSVTKERTRAGGLGDLQARLRGAKVGVKQANTMMLHGATADELGVVEERKEANFIDPEIGHKLHKIGDLGLIRLGNMFLQKYTRAILRSYAYVPQIIRAQAMRASLEETGRILAARQNLGGQLAEEFVRKFVEDPDVAASVKAISDAELAGRLQQVKLDADNAALLRQTGLAHMAHAARQAAKQGFGEAGELAVNVTMPFTTVPSNIITQALAHTPVSYVGAGVDLLRLFTKDMEGVEKLALQRRAVDRIARASTGSAALLAGYLLARHGRISGPSADTQGLRETATLAGRQPNSIRLGAHWYADAKMAPISTMVELGALMYEAVQNPQTSHTAKGWQVVKGTLKSVEDAPFFEGVKKAMNAFEDPSHFADQYVEELEKGIVPTALAHAEGGVDPMVRAPEGFGQIVKSRIPAAGLYNDVPVKLDVFGRPETHNTGVGAAITPFRSTPDSTTDPAIRELLANDVAVARLKQLPTETSEQYEERQRQFGDLLHRALTNLVTGSGYQNIPQVVDRLQRASPVFADADRAAVERALKRQVIEQVIRTVHDAAVQGNVLRGIPRELAPLATAPGGRAIP